MVFALSFDIVAKTTPKFQEIRLLDFGFFIWLFENILFLTLSGFELLFYLLYCILHVLRIILVPYLLSYVDFFKIYKFWENFSKYS